MFRDDRDCKSYESLWRRNRLSKTGTQYINQHDGWALYVNHAHNWCARSIIYAHEQRLNRCFEASQENAFQSKLNLEAKKSGELSLKKISKELQIRISISRGRKYENERKWKRSWPTLGHMQENKPSWKRLSAVENLNV